MNRYLTFLLLPLLLIGHVCADDGLFDSGGASTAEGDVLQARGEYAEGLGRGALLRSMSAKQLQDAIDQRLSNRKERVEMYYELKEVREEAMKEDRLTASELRRIQERSRPDRLNKDQFDRQTGEIYWPSPLDSPVLKPYRKPIEETFAKRGMSDVVYREFDYLRVHRMVKRIEEAVESIKDKLDVREVVALKKYLDQIDFEARFDIDDKRVDY